MYDCIIIIIIAEREVGLYLIVSSMPTEDMVSTSYKHHSYIDDKLLKMMINYLR